MKKLCSILCMFLLVMGASARNVVKPAQSKACPELVERNSPSLQNVYSYGFVDLEGAKLKAIKSMKGTIPASGVEVMNYTSYERKGRGLKLRP